MIEVYNMVNGLDKVDVAKLFARDVNGGRGHSLKLFRKRFRAQVRQRFFTNRIVDFWNSLTEEAVSASNLAIFKDNWII